MKKRRPAWHLRFYVSYGRFPNQFEIFMHNAEKNLWRAELKTYAGSCGKRYTIPE